MKTSILIATILGVVIALGSAKTIFFKANAESGAWFQEVIEATVESGPTPPAPVPPDPDNPFAANSDEWHNVSGWVGAEKTNGVGRIQRFYNPDTGEYLERHSEQLPSDG